MAKFSFGKLISVAAKAADKAMKLATKERDKQAKASTALKVKAEKERIINQRNHSSIFSMGTNDFNRECKIEIQKLEKWNKKWDEINRSVCNYNNKGIAFEKNGETGKAIAEYEKCLKWIYTHFDGEYMNQIAWHSPDRLRVLYKKLKHLKEKEFLIEFTYFCKSHNISYSPIYDSQLERL